MCHGDAEEAASANASPTLSQSSGRINALGQNANAEGYRRAARFMRRENRTLPQTSCAPGNFATRRRRRRGSRPDEDASSTGTGRVPSGGGAVPSGGGAVPARARRAARRLATSPSKSSGGAGRRSAGSAPMFASRGVGRRGGATTVLGTRSPLTHPAVLNDNARVRSRTRVCLARSSRRRTSRSPTRQHQNISAASSSAPPTTRRHPLRCAARASAPREESAARVALRRTTRSLRWSSVASASPSARASAPSPQSTRVHVLERPSCSGGNRFARRAACATVETSGAVRMGQFLRGLGLREGDTRGLRDAPGAGGGAAGILAGPRARGSACGNRQDNDRKVNGTRRRFSF